MLEGFREIASPAIIALVARRNRETESAVLKGFKTAISAMAATIASRSDDHGFMKDLIVVAGETAKAPDPLTAIGCVPSCSSDINTAPASGRWLSRLFNRELPSVIDGIAATADLRRTSAVSILSVVAPLVLTHVGRLMRKDHLHASGLTARLHREQAHFLAALPREFARMESFGPGIGRARTPHTRPRHHWPSA